MEFHWCDCLVSFIYWLNCVSFFSVYFSKVVELMGTPGILRTCVIPGRGILEQLSHFHYAFPMYTVVPECVYLLLHVGLP